MMKTIKRLASLLLALLLLPGWLPASAENEGPGLLAGSGSARPGGSFTVSVSASAFDAVSSLEFELFYDADAFTLNGASARGSFSIEDVNTGTAGRISYAGIASDSVSGSPVLLTLSFTVKETAAPGTYPLRVAVNEVYDDAFSPVELWRAGGTLTVPEPQIDIPTVTFYSRVSPSEAAQGDSVTVTWGSWNVWDLASGSFRIDYDADVLAYQSLSLLSGLQTGTPLYDVNASQAGCVRLSCASDAAASGGDLFCAVFTVRSGEDLGTVVTMTASDLYDDGYSPLNGSSCATSVVVRQPYVEPDYPDLSLSGPETVYTDLPFNVTVTLQGDSGLGAGDFTVTYDPAKLECLEEPTSLVSDGQFLMLNPNYANGTIKFSFIDSEGIDADQPLLSIPFRAAVNEVFNTEISASGRAVVDPASQPVTLDYPSLSLTSEIRSFPVHFLDHDGTVLAERTVPYLSAAEAPDAPTRAPDAEYHYAFSGWDRPFDAVTGELTVTAQYAAEAHVPGEAARENETAATCTGVGGYDEVSYCSVCGEELSRTHVTVPAAGHVPGETVYENETAATCTGVGGYDEVSYCSVCGEELSRTHVTIPAAGHVSGETVYENETAASCTGAGGYDEVSYCSIGGAAWRGRVYIF